MKYNFTDCTPRNDVGSGKWNEMKNYTIHKPEEVIPFSVADMEFQIAPDLYRYLCSGLRKSDKNILRIRVQMAEGSPWMGDPA